jgi:hypothetical protein
MYCYQISVAPLKVGSWSRDFSHEGIFVVRSRSFLALSRQRLKLLQLLLTSDTVFILRLVMIGTLRKFIAMY